MSYWSHWRWIWLLYLTAAAGYGGWSGERFASSGALWIILFLPAVPVLASIVWRWSRNRPSWQMAVFDLSIPTFVVLCIGAMAVAIAWGIAETTAGWPSPLLGAIVGAGAVAASCSFILFAYSNRGPSTQEPSLIDSE